MEYPEHEKVRKVQDKSQIIGEFLYWLNSTKGLSICRLGLHGRREEFLPICYPTTDLLGEFFEIDMKKLEKEKLKMLDSLRGLR